MNNQEILEKLEKCFVKCDFWNEGSETYPFSDNAEQLGECVSEAIWWHSGVSKIVFSFSFLPEYVIKIPFKGYNIDYIFEYAGGTIREWDYCEKEEMEYQRLRKKGVEDFFTKTEYLGKVQDYPVYIAEKASTEGDSDEDSLEGRCWSSISWVNSFHISEAISDQFIEYWQEHNGCESTKKLLNAINTLGIGDLHRGNMGFIQDELKIIDYSDFCD